MGIFIDGHEVKLPGDKLALRVTAVKQDDGTEINPASTEDIAAIAAELAAMHHLIRGKITPASGVTLTCTANATNYTQDVVAGATYRITAGSGRILLGEADTTSAANVLMVVFPGQTVLYQTIGTSLNFSTVDGAGITARLSRVDMG